MTILRNKKSISIILFFILDKFNCLPKISKEIIEKDKGNLKGTFSINYIYKEKSFFSCVNNNLILGQKKETFDIIEANQNSYYIICRDAMKIIGVDKNKDDELMMYSYFEKDNKNLNIWKLINIKEQIYYIQNDLNKKYLMFNESNVILNNLDIQSSFNKSYYEFRILKLYEEIGKIDSYELKMVEGEPIDLFIKYIDLRDKNLSRKGIKQIYKDFDNDELRYSLRSIIEYLYWIRKIFIVMPNSRVKFLKPYEEIKDKIIYVNDKDFIGFDSANIFAFSFNLYKMEKFGISKNFIYMEDDYFIGKELKKSDFFYYDAKDNKIYPYVINTIFFEMDKEDVLKKQKKMYKMKNAIKPHSNFGWNFSIMNTDKYFIEKYKIPIISAKFTHCAVPENLDDLKDIFHEIQDYEFIKETLFSKTRHVLTLNQPEFVNLYQLNIKHRKVHLIRNAYIKMEKIKLNKLNIELFVLNTGGSHKPSKEKYEKLKNIMKKRYPKSTIYEIKENIQISYKLGNYSIRFFKSLIILLIIIIFFKLYLPKILNELIECHKNWKSHIFFN